MKYTPGQKMNRNAARTLAAFSESMFLLLGEKEFDKITVNEICQRCDYPRATFYNYFDDKYDLVDYCWYQLSKDIHLDVVQARPSGDALETVFDEAFRLFSDQRDLLNRIVAHNPIDSPLVTHFLNHFTRTMTTILSTGMPKRHGQTPLVLVAQYYANTVLLVLKWVFLSQHETTLAEARTYLKELLTKPV
ncbi:TetR/AcrR family transcriptional regulator [Lacticaseibacillus baoqingensis]|uniref:TetR/AcrR family transcriptional regulator n=1 Tax=Lacticaseibacillus baoqingensis TaxID=2486013 RepID=A0ABW4EB40_9LACO|nr:TetR/AcrR family transcriptional regulator [Lacticaseibacillus baoqingensis]